MEYEYRPGSGREDASDHQSNNDRGRRSPGLPERRVNRNARARSRSPVAIDQYRPGDRSRDEYYNHRDNDRSRDDRRRMTPPPSIDRYVPGQDSQPYQPRANPLQNPLTLDYQVGFNFFAEWWRAEQQVKEDEERQKRGGGRRPDRAPKGDPREEKEKERAQIQAGYDAYKEELQAKMAKTFVMQHKAQEWFKERYVPEVRDLLRAKVVTVRHGALVQWESDLDSGYFDNFTLEGIYKTDSNGAGGTVEREEGETIGAAEVLGVGDLVPALGGDLRDDSAQQPALLIKTLAPMVSRDKIEDFCKEHLGEAEGGFKWLSLSDPNPQKKCHRIGWIMLLPDTEVDAPVERGDGRDDDEASLSDMKVDSEPKGAAKALEAINGKTIFDPVRGDFVCHVGIHVPTKEPRKKALWDLFSAPERVERDLALAKRITSKFDEEMGPDADGIAKVEQRVQILRNRGMLQQTGVTNGVKDNGMDMDEGEEEESADEGAFDEEVDDEELLAQKKTLDLLVEYLRRVHNFCLFCVFESDSVHELIRKCPGGHLRRPRASLSTAAKGAAKASAMGQPLPETRRDSMSDDAAYSPVEEKRSGRASKPDQQLQRAFNWVKTYEDKLMQLLEPENADLKRLGGLPLDDALDEELKKFVKREDESKFRCKVPECTKLFKGEVFWKKHVEKRHPEWFEGVKKDVTLVNTYVLDPAHIVPSRSDPNSNGHFPINHNLASGTPRGFNLQNLPGMNGLFPFSAGGNGAFPAFNGQGVQVQMNWGADGTGNDNGLHHPGAIRRGSRFPNNRGPYDRRQPRYGNNGRLSPPRGLPAVPMGSMRPSGRQWGDGSAVGPKEAVQGRSLKSYEDLDAVGGAQGGELNY